MNARTTKLCRKFATRTGRNYTAVKKLWKLTPEKHQNELRISMQEEIDDYSATHGTGSSRDTAK